jgi:hypothetical protein
MARKFKTRYGLVPIYPLEINNDSLEDIKEDGFFQREKGAIFGNYLTKKLNESFPQERIKVTHFDPGAITDSAGQAIYSIIYRKGTKKMPILQIRYGEERLALITNENSNSDDEICLLTGDMLIKKAIESHTKSIDKKVRLRKDINYKFISI